MNFFGNPLSRSLLGVKRTWLVAAHMSAFDPKRTQAKQLANDLWLYFSQACARGLDMPIEVEKQIRVSHRKNPGHPHNVLKIGLQSCYLSFGKLRFHFIFNDPEASIQSAHAALQKFLVELGRKIEYWKYYSGARQQHSN